MPRRPRLTVARLPAGLSASRPPLRVTLAEARRLLRAAAEADPPDPLVALWRDWRAACAAARRAGAEAARLERALVARIGTPRVAVPGRPDSFVADPADIDRLLAGPDAEPARRALKQELAAVQRCWEGEAAACGLTAACRREAETARWLDALQEAAAGAPAQDVIGVIAKLAIAAEWSAHEPEPDGRPWTTLRTALAALVSLAPGVGEPGLPVYTPTTRQPAAAGKTERSGS